MTPCRWAPSTHIITVTSPTGGGRTGSPRRIALDGVDVLRTSGRPEDLSAPRWWRPTRRWRRRSGCSGCRPTFRPLSSSSGPPSSNGGPSSSLEPPSLSGSRTHKAAWRYRATSSGARDISREAWSLRGNFRFRAVTWDGTPRLGGFMMAPSGRGVRFRIMEGIEVASYQPPMSRTCIG